MTDTMPETGDDNIERIRENLRETTDSTPNDTDSIIDADPILGRLLFMDLPTEHDVAEALDAIVEPAASAAPLLKIDRRRKLLNAVRTEFDIRRADRGLLQQVLRSRRLEERVTITERAVQLADLTERLNSRAAEENRDPIVAGPHSAAEIEDIGSGAVPLGSPLIAPVVGIWAAVERIPKNLAVEAFRKSLDVQAHDRLPTSVSQTLAAGSGLVLAEGVRDEELERLFEAAYDEASALLDEDPGSQ